MSYDRGDSWKQETSTCTFDVAVDPLPPYTEYRAGLFGSGGSLPARQVVANARAPRVRYGLSSFERNVILFSDDSGAMGPSTTCFMVWKSLTPRNRRRPAIIS